VLMLQGMDVHDVDEIKLQNTVPALPPHHSQ
jgi:hypothetical protein